MRNRHSYVSQMPNPVRVKDARWVVPDCYVQMCQLPDRKSSIELLRALIKLEARSARRSYCSFAYSALACR